MIVGLLAPLRLGFLKVMAYFCKKDPNMGLTIPSEIVRQSNMTPDELMLEFGIFLYLREKLTLAQAARISKLGRIEFQRELANRNIKILFDAQDLEQELTTIQAIKDDYRKRHLAH